MKKRVLALLLTLTVALGMLPAAASAADSGQTEQMQPAKVVVSVEGQTLSHGFYIEPTVVTVDEFIQYWQQNGVTVTPEDITAGGMIDYVLYTNGFTRDGQSQGSVTGPGYLGGIDGIRQGKGDAIVPACLADDGVTIDAQVAGDDLYQAAYTAASGWMFTEGNWLSDQSMASHKLSVYGTPYTAQDGQLYYVIRLQYTIAGLGADLGFTEWGTDYGYTAADKGQLYILYANLTKSGFFDANPGAQAQALEVMNALDATQEQVDAAYEALLQASQAAAPNITADLPSNPQHYQTAGAEAAPLTVEASVPAGTLSYQWYQSQDRFNWNAIASATTATFTPPTAENGTSYYKCVITNSDGNKLPSTVESTIATVIVGTMPSSPSIWPDLAATANYSLYASNPVPLSVSAMVYPPDGGTLSYQWYRGAQGVSSIDEMEAIPNATEPNYMPNVDQEGVTVYGCRITNTKDGNRVFTDSTLCTVTVSNNTLLIHNEEDLREFINRDPAGNYKLANDIELTGQWTPIENFSGTLDGDGHIISGLDVHFDGYHSQNGGFISYTMTGAVIKNLGLTGSVSTNANVMSAPAGGLIGVAYGNTLISNCYVDVSVTANGAYAAAGGIVGNSSNCQIENCYFTGSAVTVSDYYTAGGITGSTGGVITNSYTTNDTAVGTYDGGAGTVTNVYCASDTDPYAAKIPEDMAEFLSALNNGGNAFVEDTEGINNGYPVLSWQVEPVTPPVEPTEKEQKIQDILDRISSLLKGAGDDWSVINMAAYGYADAMDIDQLKAGAEEVAKDANPASTDYERVAIALTAAGLDASNFQMSDGTVVNFIERIANFQRNKIYTLGTVNGYIFSLVAYDCGGYQPQGHWQRDAVIQYLLSTQGTDGGWNLPARPQNASDVDLTAMAITALVPYQDIPSVNAAIERAVAFLSNAQTESGGFQALNVENSNSASQVIIALAALGIDADTDQRFVKNGKSVVDALLSYATQDNQFGFTSNAEANEMSTQQGFQALVAYTNWKTTGTAYNIYDFVNNQAPERPDSVDKTVLQQVIAAAQALNQADYTADSWAAFASALDDAKAVEADAQATQVDVYRATSALRQAMAGLVKASNEPSQPDSSIQEPVSSQDPAASEDPASNSAVSQEPAGSSQSPQTGDIAPYTAAVLALAALAATLLLAFIRRQKA